MNVYKLIGRNLEITDAIRDYVERKPWTAMARALLELIAYGLRVLLSLLPPPPGYKTIY